MHEDIAIKVKQLECREADTGEAGGHAFGDVPRPLARPVAPKEDWTDTHAITISAEGALRRRCYAARSSRGGCLPTDPLGTVPYDASHSSTSDGCAW